MISENQSSFDPLLLRAEKILAETMGRRVRLTVDRVLKQWNRNYVLRCGVQAMAGAEATNRTPQSVIVKQIKEQVERGYDDWAGVQFLSGIADGEFGPRLLGGDRDAGFFIMEDLGPGTTLEEPLMSADRAQAEAALLSLAALVGRMHAATNGRLHEYRAIRERLGAIAEDAHAFNARSFREGLVAVREALAVGEAPPGQDFESEYELVARAIEEPGSWLTYTHGDMAPSNNHYAGVKPRLLDFEYGGFRHALYDVIFWRIICPFPKEVALHMDRVYRMEVARAIPEAADDSAFGRALAELCAYDVFINIKWHFARAVEQDQAWAGGFTARRALLYKLDMFSTIAGDAGHLPALGTATRRLWERLREIWPGEAGDVSVWPAFGGDQHL